MSWPKKQLGEICLIEKGKIGISKAIPGEYPLVVTAEERLSHNEYHFEGNAVVIPLVSSTGHGHRSLKRIHYQSGRFAVGSILCVVMPKDEAILRADYLYRFLELNKEKELVGRMRGMANVTLPMKEIALIKIPVPPLEEQIKFVEGYKMLEELNAEVSVELTNQLDLVKQLRQAFLQEAMQGKLVPQDLNDEPASKLLAKIKEEKDRLVKAGKLKKQKPLSPVTEDEVLYEIPESWVWCRLGEIALHSGAGKSLKANEVPAGPGYWGVIKTSSITSSTFVESENKSFENKRDEYKDILINKGDILFCRASGSKGLAGKSCIVEELPKAKLILSDKSVRYLFPESVSKHFIHLFNSSSFAYDYYAGLGTGKSTSMNNITRDQFDNLPIPLPPISEMQRIVAKLNEVMHYCNALEVSIQESQKQNELLLQQVLREALEPKEEVFV